MKVKKNWVYRRGDIYVANLNPFKGSEQGGTRPVLVLQNNDGNFHCPTLIIAPLTSEIKKNYMPTHYLIKKAKGLSVPSMVELEQIKTIDKMRVQEYLGKVSKEDMDGINRAIEKSLDLYIPESVEAP